ncbi:MAG: hypothetical protein M1818_000624 [Claussenomyces sp. TS43310]|nr:MAG: hypothetical protein M1818_000624 [Claussenomyces sp. TS43310]
MSVRVVARIRPLLDQELEKDTIVRAECSQEGKPMNIVRIPNPKNETEEFSFAFNGVYDKGTSQEELFTAEVAPTLKSLFQGLDVTIFAYGVTGTGKTHTMRGGLKLSERGVIPRLLSGVYRRGRKVTKDSEGATVVSVLLSYYEIYNDKVYDLFEPPEKRTPAGLPLREKDGKTIVVGLSERSCEDLKDFERLYIEANNNRSTAGTKLNAQSSRSHAILMVKLAQTTGDEIRISTASAIDLAGSEDNRRTENGKERLVESASINKSLFVLSQCIDAIGRGDKRIPYRESKMTRILSLGQNNGITIMILNLSPLRSYHLDTLSSLNVSSRAKRIEVREIENEVVFKQPPRTTSSITGSNIQRQPLRPLANAHNTHLNAAVRAQKGDKPPKAFSVYSDRNKVPVQRCITTAAQGVARSNSTNKRPSDHGVSTRPSKIARQNGPVRPSASEFSAAKIEEMVERKVSEILAARASDQPAPPPPLDGISEAVQRRLDALERKIESGEKEDSRSEGLRFLLMAKQHKERGEDSSALKMYELAAPFFPAQEKLQRKIDNLRAKIRTRREAAELQDAPSYKPMPGAPVARSLVPAHVEDVSERPAPKLRKPEAAYEDEGEDDEYNGSTAGREVREGASLYEAGEECDSFVYRAPKARRARARAKLGETHLPPPDHDLDVDLNDHAHAPLDAKLTPRGRYLLRIVNSRDVARIRGLSGVGAKKARDLVDFLELQRVASAVHEDDEDDEREGGVGAPAAGGRGGIESLRQLIAVPGMGSRTVERMLEGVAGLV